MAAQTRRASGRRRRRRGRDRRGGDRSPARRRSSGARARPDAAATTSSRATSATRPRSSTAFASVRERIGEPLHRRPRRRHHRARVGRGRGAGDVAADPRRQPDVGLPVRARGRRPACGDAGWGRIVFVASVNGRFGGSALSGPAYAASKGGLLTLARFLAREHAVDGVTANAVAPGPARHADVARRSTPTGGIGSCRCSPGGDRARDDRATWRRPSPTCAPTRPATSRGDDRRQRRSVDGVTGHGRARSRATSRRAWEISPDKAANSGS